MFRRLQFVYSVLTKHREDYDTKGRDAFMKEFPVPTPVVADVAEQMDKASTPVVVRKSPVNKKVALDWANRAAMRELYHGAFTFSELLLAQVERAEKMDGRPFHWTTDFFREGGRFDEVDLMGSLEPCFHCDDPRAQEEKSLIPWLRGVSVFTMPRLVRYIVRCDLPGLTQVDIVNSHFRMLYEVAQEAGKLEEVRALAYLVENREAAIKMLITKHPHLCRDDVKRMLLAVLFGGNYRKFTNGLENQGLTALSAEIRKLAATLSGMYPRVYEMMKEIVCGETSFHFFVF